MLRDRVANEFLGAPYRLFQRQAVRQPGRDCCRVRAAGAVRCDAPHKRRGKLDNFSIAKENVDGISVWQMAAFEKNGRSKFYSQLFGGSMH